LSIEIEVKKVRRLESQKVIRKEGRGKNDGREKTASLERGKKGLRPSEVGGSLR
jgi:hypothetical protein